MSATSPLRDPANRLHRNVLRLWWSTAALVSVIVVAIAWGAGLGFDLAIAVPVLVTLATLAISGAGPLLRYRRWRYQIRERDLFLSRGALFLTRSLIPFDRIQFVETRQGPLERIFDLNQLIVYTAAGRAGQIPGLSTDEAGRLREELSKVAGTTTV